jgi:hypothetical protein
LPLVVGPDGQSKFDEAADGLGRWRSLTFAFTERNDVGRRIRIDNIRVEPLANAVGGEQTFNGGKAGQVAQNIGEGLRSRARRPG